MTNKEEIEKNCPKGHPLEKREGVLYLEEVGLMPGMVCKECNSLFTDEKYGNEEWNNALKARVERFKANNKIVTDEEITMELVTKLLTR